MATREQIEALKIDENVFELAEDTELEYLVHFAAPFTGADKCIVPKGTAFAPHGPMRADALYMHLVEDNEELYNKMEQQVKVEYEDLFTRLQGFSFFITEEQLRTLPLKFRSGSAECLQEIMSMLNSPYTFYKHFYNLALDAYNNGRWQDVIENANTASLVPGNVNSDLYFIRGYAYEQLGYIKKAKENYRCSDSDEAEKALVSLIWG
ncbi:MAG: hypothetical protein IKZ61_04370 [Prevotella sp.]|nr:hypothetical protein [Prevotella sp.]